MSALDDALDRLATKYNGNGYDPTTNPGGMDNGGHTVNFIPSLHDVATAGGGMVDSVNTAVAAAATSTTKASEASTSAGQAVAAKIAAEVARDDAATIAFETAEASLSAKISKDVGTAKGDIIGFGAASTPQRLGVGTDKQVLTVDATSATGFAWKEATGGFKQIRVTADYSANDLDLVEVASSSGPVTVTLPEAGMVQVVDITGDAATNNITVTKQAGSTIGEVDEPYIIDLAFGNILFIFDSVLNNWVIQNLTDGITDIPTASQSDVNSMLASDKYVTPNSLRGLPFVNDNLIIDGNFDFWFEGTSQTTSGYGSDTMWKNNNVGSTKTHSREAFTPGETDTFDAPAKYFSRTVVSSVAGASNYCLKYQNVEDVSKTAGRTVTFSFMAKADSPKNIALEFNQSFGTGGSPSGVITGISSELIPLTTAWEKYTITVEIPSIVGKTLGSDGNHYTSVALWFDAGSSLDSRTANLGQQSGTFDIAQVKLELGSVATPFVAPDQHQELARVRRFFWSVSPGPDTMGAPISSAIASLLLSFPVEMRTAPVITFPASYAIAQAGYPGATGTGWYSDVSSTRSTRIIITGCTGLTMGAPVHWTGTGLIVLDSRL